MGLEGRRAAAGGVRGPGSGLWGALGLQCAPGSRVRAGSLAYITSRGEGKVSHRPQQVHGQGPLPGADPLVQLARDCPSSASPLMASMSTCGRAGVSAGGTASRRAVARLGQLL